MTATSTPSEASRAPGRREPRSVRTIAATGGLLVAIFVLMALVPYTVEARGRYVPAAGGTSQSFDVAWTCRFVGPDDVVVVPPQPADSLPDPCQSDRSRRRTALLALTLLVVAATTTAAVTVGSRPRPTDQA